MGKSGLFRGAGGDVEHGEHREDERLHQTAEDVKVQGQDGGKTNLQEGDLAQKARQPAQRNQYICKVPAF